MVVRRRMEFKRSCTFSFYVLLFRKHAIGSTGGTRRGRRWGQHGSVGRTERRERFGRRNAKSTDVGRKTDDVSVASPRASLGVPRVAERRGALVGRPESAPRGIEGVTTRVVRHATQITARDRCGIFASAVFKTGMGFARPWTPETARRRRRGRPRVLARLSNTHLELIDQHRDVEQVGVIGRHGARCERMHVRLEVREATNGSAERSHKKIHVAFESDRLHGS